MKVSWLMDTLCIFCPSLLKVATIKYGGIAKFKLSNFIIHASRRHLIIRFRYYRAALNIISNNNLEYLGLTSLKTIPSGHVLINLNEKLCYVHDLNWFKLFKSTSQNSFQNDNADYTTYCGKRYATITIRVDLKGIFLYIDLSILLIYFDKGKN